MTTIKVTPMIKFLYISLICMLPAGYGAYELTKGSWPSENDTKILFIGNSLTQRNDLPSMVRKIAQSKEDAVYSKMYARGGAKLSHHSRSEKVKQLLDETDWDYVVLQEQSQLPALSDRYFAQKTLPFAAKLSDRAREVSPETKVVFYMGMAHKNGDPLNKDAVPEVGRYDGMQRRINAAYRQMARQNRASVVPVGETWARMRAKHPEIELYADDRHPSVAGTYLAACVFYTSLFSERCQGAYRPSSLNEETALKIQQLSDDVLSP